MCNLATSSGVRSSGKLYALGSRRTTEASQGECFLPVLGRTEFIIGLAKDGMARFNASRGIGKRMSFSIHFRRVPDIQF